MFLGVSQHADSIFEVRLASRRQEMGYSGDTPLSRCVTVCHAVCHVCHAVTVGLPSVAPRP